jgi:hypothetical protein
MDATNIRKLIDHFEQPRRPAFAMESYLGYRPDCGTAFCMAGHAAMLSLRGTRYPLFELHQLYLARNSWGAEELIIAMASGWLDLEPAVAYDLFCPSKALYHHENMADIPVGTGIKVLERLLETGQVRWREVLNRAPLYSRSTLTYRQVWPTTNLSRAEVNEFMDLMRARYDYEVCHFVALNYGSDIEVPTRSALPQSLLRRLAGDLPPREPVPEEEGEDEQIEDDDAEEREGQGELI